nr:M48 family metallopeptidase [uncultured Draconibacterium sp.]
MKKIVYLFLLLAIIACSTVPLTNRTQITAIPSSQMLSLSSSSYNDVLSQSQISTNAAYRSSVERVGLNISAAVESYLKGIGRAELLQGYDWEFSVIKSDQLNAWCMPGGKIAFYEGIMPICKDDNGIAVVMAHEIAHAVAKHNNERMTQQLGLQMGGLALSEALSEKETQTKQIAMAVFGVGSQVGIILPYSRSFENEADELGLYFMAMAGYDPRQAPEFWERMLQAGGTRTPEFLSTHPNPENRINHLKQIMPKALEFYQN